MKRMVAVMLGLVMIPGLGAQELRIGTIEGTANYGPLVVKILTEAGFTVKVNAFPEQGLLIRALAKGELDGAFFLAQPIVQQIPGANIVPVRLFTTNFNAVAVDPAVKIANPGDLRKYKVGIVKDHTGHQAVTRGVPVTAAANDLEQFKLLAEGKVQAIVAVLELIPVMCKAAGIKEYHIQNPPLLRSPTFFTLSRAQAGLNRRIEVAFKKWIENGQWDAETARLK